MSITNFSEAKMVLAALASLACASAANAQLMGNNVTAEWRYPDFNSSIESHVVMVSGGVELTPDIIQNDTKFEIDLGDDWVEFRFNSASNWTDTSFNGWYFADTDGTISDITGYSVDSFSGGIGGVGNIVTGFDANAFWADFGGLTVAGDGDWIRMKVDAGPPSFCLDLTVSMLTAGQSATWDISGATPGAEVAVVYGHNPGNTAINGFAGYCADFGIDGVNQKRVICRKTADGNGDISCKKMLPGNITGLRVLSQATERNTCPDTCMSNIDDQTVE